MIEKVIRAKIADLRKRIVRQAVPIEGWQVQELMYEEPGRYRPAPHLRQKVTQIAPESIIASAKVRVPNAWQGQTVFLDIPVPEDSRVEGLAYLNGVPVAGFDRFHTCLTLLLPGSEVSKLAIKLEIKISRYEWEGLAPRICLSIHDPVVEGYYHDLQTTFELCGEIQDEGFRERLWQAMETSAVLCDPFADNPAESAARAAAALREECGKLMRKYPGHGRLTLVGHSHIDVGWHWQLKESVRKTGRTFGTALNLMREYPEFVFLSSQAKLYDYAKRYYPDLFAQVRDRVAEGRWEIIGGAWIEFDANVSCGESLVRQHLLGQRFFEREFGRRAEACWLPDTFGFTGSLPQILAGCGLKDFWTGKLYWQSRDQFPYGLFWWEGIDGTRVLAHVPRLRGGYSGGATTGEMLAAWQGHAEKKMCDELVVLYGHGDGGGGVTRGMLESIRRFSMLPGLPECRQCPAGDGFRRMRRQLADNPEMPVWCGELYLETHRGTLTTKAILKKYNRSLERLLLDVEKVASMLISRGIQPDLDGIQDAWDKLLTNQFHDIMGGTCEREVHEDAVRDYQEATAAGERLLDSNMRRLAEAVDTSDRQNPLLVFNPLSWQRNAVVEIEVKDVRGDIVVVDDKGNDLDCQAVKGKKGKSLCAVSDLPPTGYVVLDARKGAGKRLPDLKVTKKKLENRFYAITVLPSGELKIHDKVRDRDLFESGRAGNVLQFFKEQPGDEPAWNIDRDFNLHMETVEAATVEVAETGALRAGVRVTKRFGASLIEQDVLIYRDLPRIDIRTRVDWQERNVMLKAAFPVNVRSLRATFEIPFGSLERPTHTNTSWDQEKFEVAAQRWADLSEPGFGVAIMNDSKYAYDVRRNVIRLTLLRSTCEPEEDADRGTHEFQYSIFSHDGDWRKNGVVRQAAEFNVPAVVGRASPGAGLLPCRASLVAVDADNVIVEAIKKAEDAEDELVVRLYECDGARGPVTLRFGFPVATVRRANMLEDAGEALEVSDNESRLHVRPFEIVTLLVRPG